MVIHTNNAKKSQKASILKASIPNANITSHKTKKQKLIKLAKHNPNNTLNKPNNTHVTDTISNSKPIDFLKWPYYKSFISSDEQIRLFAEFKTLTFKYDSKPYKPILFNRRTPIIPSSYKGKYIKFIDDNYLKYDVLPLIYSETELLKCKFRTNPPPITYFENHKHRLAAEFLKQKNRIPLIPAEYREFLFSKVKQCNNFRPTLALQTYNYLSDGIKSDSGASTTQAILDFSAGWGDRLFAACIGAKKYIGIDPNTNNTHIYNEIIKNHGAPDMQKVIASGAEYISINDLKMHMVSLGIKQFNLIFTSPPYFNYEIYADTVQSISNYSISSTGFDKWITYFLFNVIMRYTPLLCDNGYIGIYIQDTDNNNYLEPIGLFALAFAEQLGLTVCGIISSTRYPFIVLQKVGKSRVLPYKNPDNNKTFNKSSITWLFKKNYPVIYQLCERLFTLNKYKMPTPVSSGSGSEIIHKRNIYFRAFEKVFMQLDTNITTVILDSSIYENNSIPQYAIKYFEQLLSRFRIKLIDAKPENPFNGNSKNSIVLIMNPNKQIKTGSLQLPLPLQLPLAPILQNTIDEWQLLNKNKMPPLKL